MLSGTNGGMGPGGSWESLGGTLESVPVVVSDSPNKIDVYALGTDSAMWYRSWEGGWTPWKSVQRSFQWPPAALSWGPGRVDLFARNISDQAQPGSVA